MIVKYKIIGLKKLQKAVNEAPGVMFNHNIEAMHRSVNLLESLMVGDMPSGPGHFGYHAVDRFSTRVLVGPRRILGTVWNTAPQARWRESGTKAHDIAPKKALVLKIGDSFATVVHHPGEKARHSAKHALAASKGAIKVFFTDAARGVTQHMATSGD